ncbi:NAD-binding protein [Humisphaera borealis]|uniref:NAD-binding protein n=1 Tax=Humisphaera borealis TaxID=2807512 RepID=UPI0019D1C145|nr:NAD(P)-binding protein [Humisphaera borealis]
MAGFGIPGREVVNLLARRKIAFVVVELNPATVTRCQTAGLNIVQGDIADEQVLRNAGIDRATLVALAIPDDAAVLRAVDLIRRLNPAARILARCRRVSTALEASRRGAEDVVSEEQLIGAEFARLTAPLLS